MRKKLPPRRETETLELFWGSHAIAVSRGYHRDGSLGEVFVSSRGRPGGDMDGLLYDVGVLLSLVLQNGYDPKRLAKSLSRGTDGTTPASLIGVIVDGLTSQQDATS